MMVKYEIKKILCKTSNKIALLLLVLLLGVCCWLALDITYVNGNGVQESRLSAIHHIRSAKKEWAGVLDKEKLMLAVKYNNKINATPEAKSDELVQQEITYSRKQGFNDIRTLLNLSFSNGFREYNYYTMDNLSVDNLDNFYSNRIKLLSSWLYDEIGGGNNAYSEMEKAYLIKQYKSLSTPFYYDYSDGWVQLFEHSSTIIMIMMLILGYLVAGIFSSEFSYKSDSIFYSSYYGRDKAIRAKLAAGFEITTVIYWVMMLLYSAIVLGILGNDGANCCIQIHMSGWKSIYNITYWQEYLLTMLGGYIGSLFMCVMTMFISAKTRSTVLSVTVPFVLIFLPSFLGGIGSSNVQKILGLMPDNLLNINISLSVFNIYTIGGKVFGAVPILLVLYGLLTFVLFFITYRTYRVKQVL